MNNNVWQHTLSRLKEVTNRPIVTLELPGYGDADNVLDSHSVESLSHWLNEQIHVASTVIGWSLGGLVATRFALDYPEKVLSLGLVASSPKFLAEDQWPGIKPNVLTGFAAHLATDHQNVIERFMAIQAMGSNSAKQDIKLIKQAVLQKPTPTPDVLRQGLAILEEADLRLELNNLKVPCALLLGKLDALVPIKMAEQLTEFAQTIKVTVVEKASHAPFISHPEAFDIWCLEVFEQHEKLAK